MNMRMLFCLSLLIGCFVIVKAQSDRELVDKTFQPNRAKAHLGFLSSDALKGRDAPSPELKIAAEYIKAKFIEYGVSPAPGMVGYFQDVPLEIVYPPESASVSIGTRKLSAPDEVLLIQAANTSFEGKIVFVGQGREEDFTSMNVKDNIAVAICGDGENDGVRNFFQYGGVKRQIARKHGALALIEIYGSATAPFTSIKRFFRPRTQTGLLENDSDGAAIPHFWVDAGDTTLVKDLKAGSADLKIDILGMKRDTLWSQNVVGFKEGSDPNLKGEHVVYSAHYDHVGVGNADAKGDSIYNGARDNAVGTTSILSIAENIGKYPTRRSALFILFTAEEKGLLGSRWYVENSPIALSDIVYCFNSDNAGYNDTSRVSIIGLTRTSAQPLLEEACAEYGLKAMEDSAEGQNLFDRSDNVNFARKGIPAPTFGMGFDRFDADIFKYYHQPGDHMESLDFSYVTRFMRSFILSARMIANTDESLFWMQGDKYYEDGKGLYGRE